MTLHISKEHKASAEEMVITYEWLRDNATHLYVASNSWDRLIVDLSEEIPENVLKYMILKCKNVEVHLPEGKLSPKCINLLCEVYPDRAGELRKANMLGKDLNTIVTTFYKPS